MHSPTPSLLGRMVLAAALASAACSGGGGGDGGGLSLGQSSVSFAARQGGPVPAPQSIAVTVTASQAAYIVAGYPPGTPEPTWLSVSLGGSGANWSLSLSIAGTYFAPGTRTTTLRVVVARSDQSVIAYQDLQVTYAVSASLVASPAALAFTHVLGGPTETKSITLGGSPGVAFTASADQPWVTLGSSSGTTPASLTVGFDPSGLAAGSYAAAVTVLGAGQTVTVPVTLEARAPALVVSAATLAFAGVNGAPIDTQALDVSMNNGAAVPFTAAPGTGWIVLGQSGGTTPARITVGVDPSVGSLAAGVHTAPVALSASWGGTSLTATVDVQATLAKATLTVPPSLLLGGADGRDFSARPLQIALNTGTNAHAWSAVASDGWMSLSAPAGSVSATPATVDVTPAPAGLLGGTRTGSITFTAGVNGDTVTASVPVTFHLEAHRILVSSEGVAFAQTPGPSRLTRTLRVAENLGLAAPWTATSDRTWLAVTPSGTAGGDLVLTANPAGLAVDTLHLARVTIASSDPTVENTETVRVGLWIGSTAPATSTGVAGSYREIVGDPIRPYAYVHANGSSLSVFNVYTGASVGTISAVAGSLAGMTVSGDGSTLYAVDKATWKVVPVDLDTWAVGLAFGLASTDNTYPRIAWTRAGGQPVLVAADGTLRDPADGFVLATWPFYFYSPPLVAASLDGSVFCAPGCRSLSFTSLGGGALSTAARAGSLGDRDGALSPDGSVVYVPYMPQYNWRGYSTTTGGLVIQLQSGKAYPGNVEVGWDGRIYAGRYAALSSEPDVFVFNSAGAEIGTLKVVTGSFEMLDGQMALSGDGLRLLAATWDYSSSGELRFVTTP